MENSSAVDIRVALHTIAEQLPEKATWEDVIERIRFRQAVAEGKKAAENGEFADAADVSRVFAKYGVKA
ncbi:hypothetical protein ACHHRT_12970 [Desulfurivibrio sp. D14AmB]|uniref:hypothetical protein n=1 Tax=Desulfurivibrio sp. D14AmB TaxID=3374370 RepID=UPI00376F2DBA